MSAFFNQIRKEFDYIVVDSAPVGVVSDTFLIAKYCHATIYVIRKNYTDKDSIQFINNIAQDKRLKNVGVVLNETTSNAHGRYKYGYKYSYRYKYGLLKKNVSFLELNNLKLLFWNSQQGDKLKQYI